MKRIKKKKKKKERNNGERQLEKENLCKVITRHKNRQNGKTVVWKWRYSWKACCLMPVNMLKNLTKRTASVEAEKKITLNISVNCDCNEFQKKE